MSSLKRDRARRPHLMAKRFKEVKLPDIHEEDVPLSTFEYKLIQDNKKSLIIGSNLHKRYLKHWIMIDAERQLRIGYSLCPNCGKYLLQPKRVRGPRSPIVVGHYECRAAFLREKGCERDYSCGAEFTFIEIYDFLKEHNLPLPFPI